MAAATGRRGEASPRGPLGGEIGRLYRAHVGPVFAFFAYSVSHSVAEDLTSATFERVLRFWRRYNPERASERTWILAIARNLLTDHYRRESVRAATSIDDQPYLLSDHVSDDPFKRALDADELRGWLACLGDREREILALRYAGDLPAVEIASIIGLSTANVHQILSRSLRRLREQADLSGSVRRSASASAPRS